MVEFFVMYFDIFFSKANFLNFITFSYYPEFFCRKNINFFVGVFGGLKNTLYFCIHITELAYGVMVTQRFLVPLFKVRVLVSQL